MRLLFLTSRLPFPPDRGDRLRTYQFLRSFSAEHSITLVSFFEEYADQASAEQLHSYCSDMRLVHLPAWKSAVTASVNSWRGLPLQALYYRSQKMKRTIDNLLKGGDFDAAYVHLFRMAPYLMNESNIFRILDFTDLISSEVKLSLPYQSPLWRLIYRYEQRRIARYEEDIAPFYDELWFISEHDKNLFRTSTDSEKVKVIPNGITKELFSIPQHSASANRLLFVGNLEVNHNIDALIYLAEEIMPLVHLQAPESELLIVGAGVSRKVFSLERFPGVHVVGFVEDLRQVYSQSAMLAAPLRFSAGVQNKVIEAMAAGLAVVTTSAVNAGLGAHEGQEILLGDDAQSFAAQVLRLQDDVSLRRRIGDAGRAFVRAHFSEEFALERMRSIAGQLNIEP